MACNCIWSKFVVQSRRLCHNTGAWINLFWMTQNPTHFTQFPFAYSKPLIEPFQSQIKKKKRFLLAVTVRPLTQVIIGKVNKHVALPPKSANNFLLRIQPRQLCFDHESVYTFFVISISSDLLRPWGCFLFPLSSRFAAPSIVCA